MVKVRKVEASDKARWMELFRGYIVFYEADIPAEQYELTWSRLMDPNYECHGFVAELDGKVFGLTHYSFQTSTWAPVNYCYLEDLFTDPEVRGKGVGRALIDAVKAVAEAAGSSRLYWNTDGTNATARKLYDSYVPVSGKVQYRIKLD
jgi:GNAT superfamily N-acetyltransferase